MHVGEIGMNNAADEEILAFSLGRNAVVVTLDADFHTIIAVSGAQVCAATRRIGPRRRRDRPANMTGVSRQRAMAVRQSRPGRFASDIRP